MAEIDTTHHVEGESRPKNTSKPLKDYTNSKDKVWFKSNKANGYAFLSNFWPDVSLPAAQKVKEEFPELVHTPGTKYTFTLNDVTYRTVEHYFQSQKYVGVSKEMSESIRLQSTAMGAKKQNTVCKRKQPINGPKWSRESPDVMRTAILAKFSQNEDLKKALLSTGSKWLGEVGGRGGIKDVWTGGVGCGNKLGEMLMEVRETLRSEKKSVTAVTAGKEKRKTPVKKNAPAKEKTPVKKNVSAVTAAKEKTPIKKNVSAVTAARKTPIKKNVKKRNTPEGPVSARGKNKK